MWMWESSCSINLCVGLSFDVSGPGSRPHLVFVFCSWARDSSLKGPLSTQDYKMSANTFSVKRLATEERGGGGWNSQWRKLRQFRPLALNNLICKMGIWLIFSQIKLLCLHRIRGGYQPNGQLTRLSRMAYTPPRVMCEFQFYIILKFWSVKLL